MSWPEVFERIGSRIPKNGNAYGVPRGGSIVAGLLGRPVTDHENADFIVDDIVDSGRTKEKFLALTFGKPFYALVDKTDRRDKDLGWVQFPWEEEPQMDAEDSVARLLQFLGEDPKRDGLLETPKRVVKAWGEMTIGYNQDPAKILAKDFDGSGYDEMVAVPNIEFFSNCEHHMLPFAGVAHVAYIPGARVVGLSKIARLVDCFARRLQIQEKLTAQIAGAIEDCLKPRGVAVVIEAKHMCMSCRGVGKQRASMVTSAMRGAFRDTGPARAEFFGLIRGTGLQ